MISIIVCSINDRLFIQFSNSVKETIGADYEIIKIDNNIEKIGISEAYNKGARLSKYEYLLFSHEDVIFETKNWGLKLINHFRNLNNPGMLTIAGSPYFSFERLQVKGKFYFLLPKH
jgi:hypothetical protein